jgi:phage repressor protein C with HTH and peptisase S24 domain
MIKNNKLEPIKWIRVPIICTIGAAKKHETFDDVPILEWRTIREIKGARPFDQYCGAPVEGNSMIGDNIQHNDFAIFRTTFDIWEVTPGQLCAVWTPQGLLIKRVYITLNDEIRLASSNPEFCDLVFSVEDVSIQGIIVRIERDYHQ